MVLIGISVLVASVSLLVYRHPPASWSSIRAFLFQLWPGRRLEEPGSELGESNAHPGVPEDLTVRPAVPEDSQKETTGPRSVPESIIAPTAQANSQVALKPAHTSPSIPLLSIDESSSSDDDSAPSFPSEYSVQRASPLLSSDHPLQTLRPNPQAHRPVQVPGGISMAPPPRPSSSYNSTRTRPSTTALSLPAPIGPATISTRSGNDSLTLPPTATQKPPKPRKRVLLAPGHSPLDWARLQASGTDLRGLPHPHLLKVPPSQVRLHNKRTSAWTVLDGKVYNITPYLPYHPGGERELMKAAGRDGMKLFMEIHPWVNWDTMLGACLIGMAVGENSITGAGGRGASVGIVGEKWEDID
jgi:cytochrome b involved in lipid metabolism